MIHRHPHAGRSLGNSAKPRPLPPSPVVKFAFLTGGIALSAATLALVFYEVTGGPSEVRGASTSASKSLGLSHFTPVEVIRSEPSDALGLTKLITLRIPKELRPPTVTPLFSIYLKDSDIMVERPYTPLKGISEDGEMQFWVKKYDHGEVGRWFQRRNVGEIVEIRGPVPTLNLKDEDWDEVVLISGGTGITPFYQLLHSQFSERGIEDPQTGQKRPHFTLLHASSSTEALPPPEILGDIRQWSIQHPDELSLRLFVDKQDFKTLSDSGDVLSGRIGNSIIHRTRRERNLVARRSLFEWIQGSAPRIDETKKALFVVCGPESMITDIAGSRLGRPPTDQSVGGVLGAMGYTSQHVRKL